MQPFDPKLFEQQNAPDSKSPRTVTDRAVDRARESDEGHHKKTKKFTLDEKEENKKKDGKKVKHEESDEQPSPFSLASRPPKKKLGEKKEEYDPDEAAAQEKEVEGEKESKQMVKSKERDDSGQPGLQQEQISADALSAQQAKKLNEASKTQMDLLTKLLGKSITQMQTDGKTETTIEIKNLPLFANAKLTVTAFDSAKGEFNITFSELSAQAKQLLDTQSVKEGMLRHLEESGYLVHIMVATTEKEESLLTAEAHDLQREHEEKQEKEGDEEEKKKEDE